MLFRNGSKRVLSHDGIPGNERADQKVRQGAESSQPEFPLTIGRAKSITSAYIDKWAVSSLVVTASDSRSEGLGSMPDATKYPPNTHGVVSPSIVKKSNLSQALATFIPSLWEGQDNNTDKYTANTQNTKSFGNSWENIVPVGPIWRQLRLLLAFA
ncbi:hypothetical protein TNCV_3273021 [Trichonephila clavipes]|nr:hypothetical protein TNCV_3273021 [Trichonephila clavipes]